MYLDDPPDEDAPMTRIETVDQLLVIGAAQEPMREAAAEAVAELFLVASGERRGAPLDGRVQGTAVLVDDVGDVLGPLHAAFDLEAAHAGVDQLGKQIVGGEIARAEQIVELGVGCSARSRSARRGRSPLLRPPRELLAAVEDQPVRHPAALRALAAVRAPMLQRFARQALPRPAHAQGSVDEALELEIGALREEPDLLDGQLARQDDAGDPELLRDTGSLGAGDGHLRRGVERELRADRAGEPQRAQILHEDGVGSRAGNGRERLLGERKLAVEDQGVEGDESLDSLAMEEIEDARQILDGEVVRARPRVEAAAQAEIDGIGAGRHRRTQALLISRGSEQFGSRQALRHRGALY